MSPREVAVLVTPGEPRQLDDLCPRCLLPSLVEIPMLAISTAGVSEVETWIGCAEETCNEGVDL